MGQRTTERRTASTTTAEGGTPTLETNTQQDGANVEPTSENAAECELFIEVVNANVNLLEGIEEPQTLASALAGLENISAAMEATRSKLSKIRFRDARLQTLSQKYQDLALDTSTAAQELIAATKSHDLDKVKQAASNLAQAVKEEDPLVDAINEYCTGP